MNDISSQEAGLQGASGSEINIIHRREIEPLLTRAQQVIMHYCEAMDCCAVVLDRTGLMIKTPEYKNQLKFCSHCRKNFNFSSPGHGRTKSREENEFPCAKIHIDAIAESRRIEGTYVYSCAAGFFCWTSPL